MPRPGPRNGGARQSSIVKRADGRFQAKLSYKGDDGESRRLTLTGRTRDGLQDKLDETRSRLDAYLPARDTSDTVAYMAQAWLDSTLPASDRKATTKALYAYMTRKHIMPSAIGKKALRDVKPRDVEAWTAGLRKGGLSSSTVRQAYTVLRAILDIAVRDGDLAVNPAAKVARPKVERHEAAYLSPADVQRVLDAAQGSRYAPLFALLVNTGLRRGEALALKWADVSWDERVIRVRGTLARIDGALVVQDTKTEKSRRAIHMFEDLERLLKSIKAGQAADRLKAGSLWVSTGYVFTTEFGDPCDPRNALRAFTVAAKRAGVEGVSLHTLRHTAASVMLNNGVPLKVVSQVLGHSSIQITGDVYGHVAPEVSADAMAVLGAALRSSTPA